MRAQARQWGGDVLGSFSVMFSLYTNPEPEPLLGVQPHSGSPFPHTCLGLLAFVCGLNSELASRAWLCGNGWGYSSTVECLPDMYKGLGSMSSTE